MNKQHALWKILLAAALVLGLALAYVSGCFAAPAQAPDESAPSAAASDTASPADAPPSGVEDMADASPDATATPQARIAEDGQYTAPEDVAAYLYEYGRLPGNFITKGEARGLGWVSSEGNLWDVAPGMSIGGDVFGNREGGLPDADGRVWYECDVNYGGGFRGAERLLFSSDGLVYYSPDHYETFTRLY